jgi:hypothetical protein
MIRRVDLNSGMVVLLVGAIAILHCAGTARGADPKAPDITTTFAEIKKDFSADATAAATKYLGKIVRIDATVTGVSEFNMDNQYIFTLGDGPRIRCTASDAAKKAAKAISATQSATIQGKCIAATADKFALSACEVVKVGDDPSKKITAADLAKAFADKKGGLLDGSPLTVEGTVASVSIDHEQVVLDGCTADGKTVNVNCLVGTSGEGDIKSLKKGDKITLKGTCSGMLGGSDVILQDSVVQN